MPFLSAPRAVAPFFLLFFFSCSAALRDLHSFPTRRSSDLIPRRFFPRSHAARPPRENSSTARGHSASLRSEEHTSELQSHLNLVCRLLLEKKSVRRWYMPDVRAS